MMTDNRRIRNVCSLVKFRANLDNPTSKNRILTKTLGKVGFIDSQYRGILPSDEEFWFSSIDSMVTKGSPSSGIFVLTPIKRIERDDICYLTHGMYDIEDDAGVRYVMPKIKEAWWVMSLQDRRLLFGDRIHAVVIVNHDHETGAVMRQITRAGGQIERLRNNDLLRNEQLDAELGLEQR